MTHHLGTSQHRKARERITVTLVRWLVLVFALCPSVATAVVADSTHTQQLAIVDSLIIAGSSSSALDLIDAALRPPGLSDSLWAEFNIQKLKVLRYVDQWDIMILLSDELLPSGRISESALVRIRLLRAVAFENMDLYPLARKELDSLQSLFDQRTKDRYYGEYLYRTASFYRVQKALDLAIDWAQRAIDFNENGGHTKELASSFLVMGYSVLRHRLTPLFMCYLHDAERE